ncbi:MAG: hypothetical protein ACT4OP_13225 [Actinomycetota bacterium]
MRRWVPAAAGMMFILAAAIWLGALGAGLRAGEVTFGDIVWSLAFAAFPVVGLIVAVRRPGNLLGWCWLASVVLLGVGVSLNEYANQLLDFGTRVSDAALYGLISASVIPTGVALLALPTAFLFPDGRLANMRWRQVAWSGVAATVVFSLGNLLRPKIVLPAGEIENPIGIEAASWLDMVVTISGATLFVVILLGVVSLILRYHRSKGEVRLQLKWVALVLTLALGSVLLLTVVEMAGYRINEYLAAVPLLVAGWGFPAAVGLAILRYRLYTIDRLISRTLVYGSVILVLAVMYFGGVAAIGALVGENNSLAVAGSTLAAAALFTPLRRRLHGWIERRFDRARYDAQQEVDAFSGRLRDEVDLGSLTDDLSGVVDRTLRPDRLSVWLAGK